MSIIYHESFLPCPFIVQIKLEALKRRRTIKRKKSSTLYEE